MSKKVIFIKFTTKAKENKIQKIMKIVGFTNLVITDKGAMIDVEPSKSSEMVRRINEIESYVSEVMWTSV